MRYTLADDCALKWLEEPCVYHIEKDELYELDEEAFEFLKECSSPVGCEAFGGEFLDYCLREGILKAKDSQGETSIMRPPLERSAKPSLRYLELQITRRCNLKCRHCYIGPSDGAELALEDIENVLEQFQRMQGLRVLITGGEPVLHSNFNLINALLPSFALRKILFTNGTLLDKRKIGELNVHELQIRLDGMREAHDALRGDGTFGKAMRCIEEGLSSGLQVSVCTMVHSRNMGDFDQMEKALLAMGIKDWTVDVPCPEGYMKENPALQLSPEEAGRLLGYGFGDGLHGGGEGHECGLHLMSVMADGRCAKCAFYKNNPLGHISDGLERCWNSLGHLGLGELECDCDVLDSCRGGCRYRAELLSSRKGKDLYRCAYYGKINKSGLGEEVR
jgi:radical SAM protein with 4Fe4S-binding SPASM domain